MDADHNRIHHKSFFRNFLALLESLWNRSYIQDSKSNSNSEPQRESERSFQSSSQDIQGGLQDMGTNEFPRRMDEEISSNVSSAHNVISMLSKYEKDIQLPKTREEEFAESIFEWVKTEREGDVCKFRQFVVENGTEYTVFEDGTRVNTTLIGDVVLMHKHPEEIISKIGNPLEKVQSPVSTPHVPPPLYSSAAQLVPSNSNATASSPIFSILEKSKKKKKKIQLEITADLPSAEVLSIVRDNFDASDDELFAYLVNKIDKKKFIASVIASVNK